VKPRPPSPLRQNGSSASTPTRPPRSETGANPCSLRRRALARLHVPVGSEQSSLQTGLFTTTFVRGKGEALRQQCVLDRFILQGQEHDAMRPASVRRTGDWRVSPVTTYGGLPQDGRNLPQDDQRSPQDGRGSPTRRSAPPLSSPLLSPIPCSLLCAPFSDVPYRSCSSCTIPSTKTHQIGAKSGYFSLITTGAISSYAMMKFRS